MGSQRPYLREVLLAVSGYLTYQLARLIANGPEQPGLASRHAWQILHLERTLHLSWEDEVQAALAAHHAMLDAAGYIYIYGYLPTLVLGALWLFLRHREHYAVIRNAFLISGALGLIVFITFPVAPPRLVPGMGITDTIAGGYSDHPHVASGRLTNDYAALPSFHVGWNFLVMFSVLLLARRKPVAVAGLSWTGVMTVAVLATGNHFLLDAVAGCLAASLGLLLAELMARRHPGGWLTGRPLSRSGRGLRAAPAAVRGGSGPPDRQPPATE